MMPDVLILGYGSPLRGDDAIGWNAANALRSRPWQSVRVLQVHQLTPELAVEVRSASAVLFVDAAREGTPGTLQCHEVSSAPPGIRFTHQFNAATLIDLTREIFGSAPPGYEITLAGESFDLTDQLSPRVAAEMPRLIDFVAARAEELGATTLKGAS